MADYIAYFNGEWMPYSQVKIDPSDRGFVLGDVVFDTGRTFNGKPFRMKQHVDRLYRSLNAISMDANLSPGEMTGITEEALSRNEPLRERVGDFKFTQFVTRGQGGVSEPGEATVCVRVAGLGFKDAAQAYTSGVHASITRTQSYTPVALDPKIKHYSRMNFVLAEIEANRVEPGAWAILTDDRGNLSEGTGSNVFLMTNGVVRTPTDRAVLQGVSRQMVLDLADQLGLPAVEEDLQPYDLYTADEAFLSRTSPCVLPITSVDKRQIGDGKPGPIATQLLAAWSEAVGVDIVDQALKFAAGE